MDARGLPINDPLTWSIPAGASTQIVNGYPMAYSASGHGPTVVFVGGVLTDYRVWAGGRAFWEPQFRAVTVSLRHFYPEPWKGGGSDFSVPQHAKDLARFIELQGGPVYLVGWSYGAQVAFETARRRPDLVKKLVLAEAPLYTLLPAAEGDALVSTRAKEVERQFERGDMEGGLNYAIDAINGPGVWGSLNEIQRQGIRDNAWSIVGIGRQEPPLVSCADFGALQMPVLLVKGEATTPRFQKVVALEASCLPTAIVVTIPKAGHTSPVANPAAFEQAAAAFFRH